MNEIKSISLNLEITGELQKAKKTGDGSFAEAVKKAMDEVARIQNEAEKAIQNFAKGEVKDIHTVVLAMEKADVSLQLLLQVRNKLLDAYQEIIRMQV